MTWQIQYSPTFSKRGYKYVCIIDIKTLAQILSDILCTFGKMYE